MQGQRLCGSCKVVVVKNRKRPPSQPVKQGKICNEARYALICSGIGLTCCCLGLLMHPLALFLSYQAVHRIKSSSDLVGIELARAAQVTSIVGLFCAFTSIASSFLAILTSQ